MKKKKQQEPAVKRLPRAITADRIFDLLVDIQLRHKRDTHQAVSNIVTEHGFTSTLTNHLLKAGFVQRVEGQKLYVYTGMEPTKELAEKIREEFAARERVRKDARRPMNGAFTLFDNVREATEKRDQDRLDRLDILIRKVDHMCAAFRAVYKELTGHEFNLEPPQK